MYRSLYHSIIGCAYSVFNELGFGFLEKVYENALVLELKKNGLQTEQQKKTLVFYKHEPVGFYICNIIVENTIIVELKACNHISSLHRSQIQNYL